MVVAATNDTSAEARCNQHDAARVLFGQGASAPAEAGPRLLQRKVRRHQHHVHSDASLQAILPSCDFSAAAKIRGHLRVLTKAD
jgi:hypothetical protein